MYGEEKTKRVVLWKWRMPETAEEKQDVPGVVTRHGVEGKWFCG